MSESVTGKIHSALMDPHPRESASRAKSLAAQLFEAADPKVHIRFTEYFNNTYTPDMTMSWDGAAGVREVYLRATGDLAWIAQDLEYVPSGQSTVVSLTPQMERAADPEPAKAAKRERTVRATAEDKGVLIADSESVEQLGYRRSSEPSVGLFSSALLRGGRGYFGDDQAGPTIDAVVSGFSGAQIGDKPTTSSVLQLTHELLNQSEDRRIAQVLQALWVGGGADASSFPATETELRSELDGASLKFLLEHNDLVDASFWERLARSVDLPTLLALDTLPEESGLSDLMRFTAHRFRAKACAVRGVTKSTRSAPRWSLREGRLVLSSHSTDFHVALTRNVAAAVPMSDQPLSADRVVERADEHQYSVVEMSVSQGTRTARFQESEGGLVGVTATRLRLLFDDEPIISGLVVNSPSDRVLGVDVADSTIYGRANAKPYVSDLIEAGVSLLTELPAERVSATVDLLAEDSQKAVTVEA